MTPEEAVRLVLELRGPVTPDALREALAAMDVEVGDLAAALAAAGAVEVVGPAGAPVVALAAADPDEPRLLALLREAPPALLAALVVAVLLVAAVLLAGLNDGVREGPTLRYRPPVTTTEPP